MKKRSLTNKSGEVRDLTRKDIRNMRSGKEILPETLLAALAKRKIGQRGKQKEPTKISITVRYSPEVVNYFKETGAGWQIRMNQILKEWIKKHPHHA